MSLSTNPEAVIRDHYVRRVHELRAMSPPLTYRQIALRLDLSVSTVGRYAREPLPERE